MTETGPRALRRRVLIVEDEAPIRELMRLHLGLAGFDAVECATGTLALERARAEKFDLILLDVMLPVSTALPFAAPFGIRGSTRTRPS